MFNGVHKVYSQHSPLKICLWADVVVCTLKSDSSSSYRACFISQQYMLHILVYACMLIVLFLQAKLNSNH